MDLPLDGTSVWIIVILTMCLAVCLLILMSQRQALRDQSRALESKGNSLRALMNNAPVEIYLKDRSGRYLEINKHFERLFDITNDEIKGLLPTDVHDPGLAERSRRHDLEVLRTGAVSIRDEQVHTTQGSRVLHTIKFPVFDDIGEVSGLGAIVWDITE